MSKPRPPVRMIATDIDGTMIRNDGTLSSRVRGSLRRASKAGIHVVPATGRPEAFSADVIEALGLHQYWIFANGSMTRRLIDDTTVRAFWMDLAVVQGLVLGMRQRLSGVAFAMELEHGMAYEPNFAGVAPKPPPFPPVDDVLDALVGRVQKVLVCCGGASETELYENVSAAVGDRGVVSYSGLSFVEVAARLVTKATALSGLCQDLGIDRSEVAAFGDNHNDVAMLEWAGRSYAMERSSQDALAAADKVIGSNEDDALADIVDEIVAEHDPC